MCRTLRCCKCGGDTFEETAEIVCAACELKERTALKLYLIAQHINEDYDTYDSAIVCAESEEEARRIHPDSLGETEIIYIDAPNVGLYDWTDLEHVKVTYVGKAVPEIEKGVVCSSFNAG